jgi:sulfur-oxidizing protein SoxY
MLSRRQFSLGAAAATLLPLHALAQEQPQAWEQAVKSILGEAKPTEAKLTFDMPEIAENGNTVPFSVRIDSPMTEKDHVRAIHIISTGNPQPGVATFRLTPQSGRAMVSSRMRLARTQDVIAIAELSDSKFLMSKRAVKVTIGGCGG